MALDNLNNKTAMLAALQEILASGPAARPDPLRSFVSTLRQPVNGSMRSTT